MLKKFTFSLMAIIALSIAAIAQDNKNETTLTGNLVDKACSARVAKQADAQAAAASHGKDCALMESCLKSGLGIYSGGKYYLLDAKGVELAKAALEKSKKDKGAVFKVTGKVSEGNIAVESLAEVE